MTDFWRDLQAWTQAQYDARVRASGLRRNNLAADINKLLRDRLSYRLTIKDGTPIGAEFLRTAGRLPFWWTYVKFECGLMISDQAPGLGRLPEVGQQVVYLNNDEVAYFADATADFHVQGARTTDAPITFYPYVPPEERSYLSMLYYEAMEMANMDPLAWLASGAAVTLGTFNIASMYTGLMRLAVQSKLGAKADLTDLFPWGIGPPSGGDVAAYEHDGLIRSDDFEYFVVRLNDSSCKVCRMKYDSELNDLVEKLYSNEITDPDDRDRIESVILSTLEPVCIDGELDEISLLDAATITPDADGLPLAYGWKYSYPPTFKASIIRNKEIFYDPCPESAGTGIEIRPSLLTINFTISKDFDGVNNVSASAEYTQYDPWTLNGANNRNTIMWLPKPLHRFNLLVYLRDCCARDLETEPVDAPIYCFYTRADEDLQIVKMHNALTLGAAYHTPSLAVRNASCHPMSTLSYVGTTLQTVSIGFSINGEGGPIISESSGVYVEYTTNVSFSSGGNNDRFIRNATNPGATAISNSKCGGPAPDPLGYIKEYRDVPSVSVTATEKIISLPIEQGDYIPTQSSALVIPRLNAEAAVIFSRKARTVDYEYSHTRSGILPLYSKIIYEYYTDIDRTILDKILVGLSGFKVDGGSNMSSGSSLWESAAGTNRWYLDTRTLVASNYQEREYTTYVKTSNSILTELGDSDAWNGYFNPDRLEDFISFSLQESWAGSLIYPIAWDLQEPYRIDDYIDKETIEDSGVQRWIGWS